MKVSDLRSHPRNYRKHPAKQLTRIRESLRDHGFYKNVVAAEDLTILTGHGVVLAAELEGDCPIEADLFDTTKTEALREDQRKARP